MHKKFTYIVYQIIMAILAVISIGMLIAYYAKRINIDTYPYNMIDNGIWLASLLFRLCYPADYFTR